MMTEDRLQQVLSALVRQRSMEWPRLARIRRYLKAEQLDLYVPNGAGEEFRQLVRMSHFNILPRVVRATAQDLYVDGYRPTGPGGRAPTTDSAPIWHEVWQTNRMDSRQAGLFRSAITYGASFATVVPGVPAPVLTPYSPLRLTALYDDPTHDEWPQFALTVERVDALTAITAPHINWGNLSTDGRMFQRTRVWDASHIYTIEVDPGAGLAQTTSVQEHGLGVCPVVRFTDAIELDDNCPEGKVEPLIPLQQQIDQTTFSLLMTQQYQAFRQRWATGMAVERDEQGRPIEPWNASIAEVWVNDSPDGRFGDFAETSLQGYLESRRDQLLFATSVAQIPPHQLVIGNAVSNISADALVALETAHRQDVAEHQICFGESLEQMMRLAGRAHGVPGAWEDMSAQVVWRDTTPRSLAQVADALGKLATQLEIPRRALWERIPHVTDQDLARWEQMAQQDSPMTELRAMLTDPRPEVPPQERTAGADGTGQGPPAGG